MRDNDNSLKARLDAIDWQVNEHYEFSAENAEESLRALIELKNRSDSVDVGNKVMRAFANDHRGSFKPALFQAIDLLIEIGKCSNKEDPRVVCVRAILDNLYYFEPDPVITGVSICENYGEVVKAKISNFLEF